MIIYKLTMKNETAYQSNDKEWIGTIELINKEYHACRQKLNL